LNPYLTQLGVGFDILSLFMETLLEADDTGQYGPRLAEAYQAAPDGLSYTFKLRTGVKWLDGGDVTAQDVMESYNMIMTPDFGAFFQQGWELITGSEAPDGQTVVFTLDRVFAPCIANVGGSYIVPASALTKGIQC